MTTDLTSGLDTAAFSSVIKPSDDLFRFVNGPWIDTYRLPDDKARYGSFDKLAQALYRSFMDTDAIEAAGATPIRPALDAIDHAADKAALTRTIGALKPIDMGPDVFDIAVFGDPKNPDTNVVHLEQSGIGLPDEAYYREDHYAPIREAYVDMVAKQLRLAGYGDEETTRAQADRFLDVETRIAANHWDNVATRDSQKTYNPTDFVTLSDELAHFNIAAWADAWQGAYDATPAAKTQPVDLTAALQHTIVHEPSFLKGFDAFWNNADLDDLKLWARVHVIIGTASLLSHDYDVANFDFYGKVLSGTTQQRDRWRRGVSLVNGVCGEDVGLIDAYRVSITNSDWLGEETKAKALEKLSKFTPMIGYTERWRDYTAFDVHADAGLVANMQAAALYEWGFQLSKAGKPVDKGEWLMNPQTVNAYYEPSMNVIVFPAAILQPPFFNPDAEDAANYGGIGAVIGHEIGHGFDDQGAQYDGDGVLNDWWTADDKANFEKRTKALIEQYNAFVPTQLDEKYADEPDKAPHVNGALTIGENIGDLGGVNIALKAYAFALDEAAGRDKDGSAKAIEESLSAAPVMDGWTGLQRFFLSYASIWRSKNRDELAEKYLQIDPHSPAECRTNGIVRNVDLFYRAFDVTPDSAMWLDPDKRVRIW